jgi:hypothetical protein
MPIPKTSVSSAKAFEAIRNERIKDIDKLKHIIMLFADIDFLL